MKDRQAIVDYGFEHATSLRGKYTRKGRFLCSMYTLVGYAKPSVGPPNYSNGSGGAIPSPKLAIQQPFYACLCLTMPILRYDWNSGFHTPAPATCSFAESTCLFYPRRYVGQSKIHMSSWIDHITSEKKSWKYSLPKKKCAAPQKFPAPNYFARNALKTVHTCRDEVFAQFSTSLGRSSLSWEALQFSAAIYDKHIVPLLVSHYLSTCLQFHYFAAFMQFC